MVRIEKDFIIDGYRCVIVGSSMGHRCGYVEIPADHKYYGVDYEVVSRDIGVHGGWTYSEHTHDNYPVESSDKSWWVGFDCGHWNDAVDLELIKSFGDDEILKHHIMMREMFPSRGVVRTTEYVENELIEAVKQLKEI